MNRTVPLIFGNVTCILIGRLIPRPAVVRRLDEDEGGKLKQLVVVRFHGSTELETVQYPKKIFRFGNLRKHRGEVFQGITAVDSTPGEELGREQLANDVSAQPFRIQHHVVQLVGIVAKIDHL